MIGDINKCRECMNKIRRRLEELGINFIMTTANNRDTILCKFSSSTDNSNSVKVTTVGTSLVSSCPYMNSNSSCPYTACKYPGVNCHKHNANTNNGGNIDSDNNGSGALEAIMVPRCSLFRIMPNDTNTGIFLHAIKLHGEVCDLKMSFEYTDPTEIINVIKFLSEE